MTDKKLIPLGVVIIRNALLTLLCVFAAFIASGLPRAVRDLRQAEEYLASESTAKHYRITRSLAGEIFVFVLCPKTLFFLYTDAKGVQHLGYYYEQLPLLEKEFKVPYVGSRFEEIPPDVELTDSPTLRAAEQQLNKLPASPLSLGDKVALLMYRILIQKGYGRW